MRESRYIDIFLPIIGREILPLLLGYVFVWMWGENYFWHAVGDIASVVERERDKERGKERETKREIELAKGEGERNHILLNGQQIHELG
jgi:hypothetical protein